MLERTAGLNEDIKGYEDDIKKEQEKIKQIQKQIDILFPKISGLDTVLNSDAGHVERRFEQFIKSKDLKSCKVTIGALEALVDTSNRIKEQLEELADLYDDIRLANNDIEAYENDLSYLRRKLGSVINDLETVADSLESQGDSTIALAVDRVSDSMESFFKAAKYVREKGHGTPGQPGYKPTLWYMITPEGKKVLVDQWSNAN
jgi:chromosome segregation ATPase